nr:3-deoxy-D-manno-octulosonic acid transferase [Alphaproteobacteria bacterium]
HQYYPLDVRAWVSDFLNHWQPDMVLWVEQEIWPNMLHEIHQRQIPAILANGRLTEKSLKRWLWIKSFARNLLAPFRYIYAQSVLDGNRYEQLSGRSIKTQGNLKYAAAPLPYPPLTLDRLKKEIGDRPIWLAASTHLGEEFVIAEAHKLILTQHPDALLIIVPRHPDRGDQITQDLNDTLLNVSRRSYNEPVRADTQVYLADTFSELGLFYRLSRIAFIGGSLMPIGGHNLIEAAQLECAVLYGPHMHNFQEVRDLFEENNLSLTCTTAQELSISVLSYMDNPDRLEDITQSALGMMEKQGAVLQDLIQDVEQIADQQLMQTSHG